MSEAAGVVEQVARTSYGRLLAFLAGVSGDIAAAEDALADALVSALVTWPAQGVPDRPESWLRTVARRNLIDAARRRGTASRALPELARLLQPSEAPVEPVADDRLRLMFACTHPAIAEDVRSPLMLQTVLGLQAADVAAAFLVSPAAMSQRLVRAKAKIKAAGVPFTVPTRGQLPDRLASVLDALYTAYGTGWGAVEDGTDLTAESVRLARLVVRLLPGQPEAWGLLALLLHLQARVAAGRAGGFTPLAEQDVTLWDPTLTTEAERALDGAQRVAAGRVGPYQLLAAISSVHARRVLTGRTDWQSVLVLYDELLAVRPVLGVVVARAAAARHVHGATAALRELDALPPDGVRGYQPYWVLRAHCLLDLGGDAAPARTLALALTVDPAVRRHLEQRLVPPTDVDPDRSGPSA